MLNNFFKTIHNRFSKFFRFIFFLRYLFVIFLIFTVLFLIIPIFFDYEKKAENIKKKLFVDYNIEIKKYDKIEFSSLPWPKIEIHNVIISLDNNTNLYTQNLNLYPNINGIYNINKFEINKLILKSNKLNIEASKLKSFLKKIFNKKNKFFIDNLSLKITDESKKIINLKNIKFRNYGYNKNLILGEVFEKKFQIKVDDKSKDVDFKILNSGISAVIAFDALQDGITRGVLKSKILNTNLKLNFDYNKKILNINNFYLRNKDLSFKNESFIIFNPFLEIKSSFRIEDINPEIFQKINIKKLIQSKNFIKRISSKNIVTYDPKKFTTNLINNLNLEINLAYGRMNYHKKLFIADNFFNCKGDINFLEEQPLLFFDCSINTDDKQNLFKQFSIKIKDKNKSFKLKAKGSLNILNKKINFKQITTNENYKASKEDLRFFKEIFEDKIFDEELIKMFSLKKIKKFILEIS